MLDSFSLNATVAKALSIYGKRLTADDYKELMHRNNVSEIADYLKRNTHYGKVLESIDTNTIHRGFLESLLRHYEFDLYVRLCKFQHLDKTPFYNYIVIRQEIEEIISCILHLNAKASDEYITGLPSYLINHASYNLIELAKSRSYQDLLNVIKKTPYYALIKDEVPDENGVYDCTKIEIKLMTYYHKWLNNTINDDFNGKTAKDLNYLITTQIDIVNIINGFRMKTFFNTNADNIEKSMLPFYGRLSKNKQYELFEAVDEDDYIKRLQKNYYGRQLGMFDSNLDKTMLEKYTKALKYKYAKLTLMVSSSAPVSIYTILFLFDIEVENIINIIEGIRYKAPLSFIEKLLIL